MSGLAAYGKTDARRLVEASAWKTHLAETNQESTPEFEAWLEAAEDNRLAWERVQHSWDLFGEHATAPEVLDLRRSALRQARDAGRKRWGGGWFSSRWKQTAMAAGVAAAAIGALVVLNLQNAHVYRTEAGERRMVTLADGSQVQLDALTELRVNYSERARDLTLVKGQARFDVARDVERPFAVFAAGQKVIALGTAFNVDLLGQILFVTLIDGKVVVLPSAEAARAAESVRSVELSAGQQLTVSDGGARKVATANVQRATAWQTGQLIFDDEPLSSVITRINRYADKPLQVSEEAAALRLSGVFNTGDVAGFVATVTHYLPVEAQASGHSIQLQLAHR